MEHKRLPRGAKQVSEWVEVSSMAYPKGYCDEVTVCTYEADVAYPNGNMPPFVMSAVMVTVYDKGKRIYKQAFYGETAHTDAQRNAQDVVTKALYATV